MSLLRHSASIHKGLTSSTFPTGDLREKILFYGKVSQISGGQMPNIYGEDYITVSGTQGNYTMSVPDTQDYIDADTDNLWFDVGEVLQDVTSNDLVSYDYDRTFVKYANTSPYYIDSIIILKSTATLTQADEDELSKNMQLDIYYFGYFNDNGVLKENRPSGSPYDEDALAYFNAMTTKPSSTEKDYYNTLILGLKSDGIFVAHDELFILGGHTNSGGESLISVINPVKSAELVSNTTFTQWEGVNGDGISGYLDSKYNPTDDGSNYVQNSGCFWFILSNIPVQGVRCHGTNVAPKTFIQLSELPSVDCFYHINSNSASNESSISLTTGLFSVVRRDSANQILHINGTEYSNAVTSKGMPAIDFYLGARNIGGGTEDRYGTDRIAACGWASGLSELDLENIASRFKTFFTSVGKTFMP